MATICVCPLSQVDRLATETGARSLVSLVGSGMVVSRPGSIAAGRHLQLSLSDISVATEGHVLPVEMHVHALLDFVRMWDRAQPLLIHCYAGVSRSTAAAYAAACALTATRDEPKLAGQLRQLSPTATPNARIVALADDLLGRGGRMIAAIERIGRGAECFEGVPFRWEID